MALRTLGTNATNSLNALLAGGGMPGSIVSAADFATFNNSIKDDKTNSHFNPAVTLQSGQLFIPNRGVLQVLPGDFVAVDANGWPILVSAFSIATGGWTHT